MGQGAEIVVFAVFDYNDSARSEHLRAKDFDGDRGEIGHVVGWVGEDDVELLGAAVDKLQGVAFDEGEVVDIELSGNFFNEIILCHSLFYGGDISASARQKLESDGACAGKEVKSLQSFEVNHIFEHVEDILTREVGCRARGYVCRHIEAATAKFSTYYSHNGSITRGNGAVSASRPLRKAAEGKITGITHAAYRRSRGIRASRSEALPQSRISSERKSRPA